MSEPAASQAAPSGATTWADLGSSLVAALAVVSLILAPLTAFAYLLGVGLRRPQGLWLGLLVIPLFLLHVLRSRRPRRPVGSLLLWEGVLREQQASHPFQRLRRSLVLILQLLALALLTYGLADPIVRAEAGGSGRRLALVLDVSASMLAREQGGETRFAAARREARQLVSGLRGDDEAAVIVAGPRPYQAVPWTGDLAALRRGLEGLEARPGPARLAQALVLAAASEAGRAAGLELHVFSDGSGPAETLAQLPGQLVFHPQGQTSDNLGLVTLELAPGTGASAREDGGEGAGLAYEIFAAVQGPAPGAVFVTVEQEGRTMAARKLTLTGGGAPESVALEARLQPGPVSVRLLDPSGSPLRDALALDDRGWLIVPQPAQVVVALASQEPSPALERALAAAGAEVVRFEAQESPPAAALLVVYEGSLPAVLPARDCLLVDPPDGLAELGPVAPGQLLDAPRLAGWDETDPVLRYLELDDVELGQARGLELGPGARPLIQARSRAQPAQPVAAAFSGPGRSLRLVLGFDPYRGNWTRKASFPIWARNLVLESTRSRRLPRLTLPAGVPLTVPAQAFSRDDGSVPATLELTRPDGQEVSLPVRDGEVQLLATDQVGLYSLRRADDPDAAQTFAVNLVDAAETQLTPQTRLPLGEVGEAARLAGPRQSRPVPVAAWFALLALSALVVEAWAYHRRW